MQKKMSFEIVLNFVSAFTRVEFLRFHTSN